MIVLDFLVSALEAEQPYLDFPYELLEHFFNIIFLVELLLNQYSSFLLDFWRSPWNVFDFFIVLAAWCGYIFPGERETLRLCRPFRIFRLCRRFEALRII